MSILVNPVVLTLLFLADVAYDIPPPRTPTAQVAGTAADLAPTGGPEAVVVVAGVAVAVLVLVLVLRARRRL